MNISKLIFNKRFFFVFGKNLSYVSAILTVEMNCFISRLSFHPLQMYHRIEHVLDQEYIIVF